MGIKYILFASLLLGVKHVTAQEIADLKLDHKLEVLNNKASFLFPQAAFDVARKADIVSADPGGSSETRIMLDIGKMRMVVMAEELFVTSGKNLLQVVSKINGAGYKTKLLVEKDSMLAVLRTPQKFDSTKNTILVNTMLVRTPDNSVFRISAFINLEGFKQKDDFVTLSERIFASIAKGTKRNYYVARIETIPIFDSKKSFLIRLPKGYVVTKNVKRDFEVLNFQKIKDIADTNAATLTIYTGFHPSWFHHDYNLDSSTAIKVGGKLLDKKIEWMYFKVEAKSFYLKEQKMPFDPVEKNLIIHIAMEASTPAAITELTTIVEAIKLVLK